MKEPLSARDLAAFAAAVEAGSVQGAAEALGLTQSAATKRIQSLERRLGATLLVRGRHGAQTTEDGRALYPEARLALDALAAAERAVLSARKSRPLRIVASHTVGECLLPGWLADFRSVAPDLHPHVDVVNSPAAIAVIRQGGADVGFVEGLESLDGLEAMTVEEDELVVTVAAGHAWARRVSIAPGELTEERFVSREARSGTRAVAEARLAGVGVRLEPALTMASLEAVKRSLASGGFALISHFAVEAERAAGLLATVPIEGLTISRPLTAIRPSGGPQREPGGRLWRWLDQRRGDSD